uniref:Uncharacterized protein n=1 Tax=Octopus bimaculoides TaxID=37653 RepID=A0A0L8IHV9_OCTBM
MKLKSSRKRRDKKGHANTCPPYATLKDDKISSSPDFRLHSPYATDSNYSCKSCPSNTTCNFYLHDKELYSPRAPYAVFDESEEYRSMTKDGNYVLQYPYATSLTASGSKTTCQSAQVIPPYALDVQQTLGMMQQSDCVY